MMPRRSQKKEVGSKASKMDGIRALNADGDLSIIVRAKLQEAWEAAVGPAENEGKLYRSGTLPKIRRKRGARHVPVRGEGHNLGPAHCPDPTAVRPAGS